MTSSVDFDNEEEMAFYEFETVSSDSSALLSSPVDVDLKPFFWGEKLVAKDNLGCRLLVLRRGVFHDKLRIISRHLVLSERAYFVTKSLKIFPETNSIDVQLCTEDGGVVEDAGKFVLLWHEAPLDLIDRGRSKLVFFKEHIIEVEKAVLKGSGPDCDLFPVKHIGWVVSQRFIKTFAQEKLSGCRFLEIEVTNPGHA